MFPLVQMEWTWYSVHCSIFTCLVICYAATILRAEEKVIYGLPNGNTSASEEPLKLLLRLLYTLHKVWKV